MSGGMAEPRIFREDWYERHCYQKGVKIGDALEQICYINVKPIGAKRKERQFNTTDFADRYQGLNSFLYFSITYLCTEQQQATWIRAEAIGGG